MVSKQWQKVGFTAQGRQSLKQSGVRRRGRRGPPPFSFEPRPVPAVAVLISAGHRCLLAGTVSAGDYFSIFPSLYNLAVMARREAAAALLQGCTCTGGGPQYIPTKCQLHLHHRHAIGRHTSPI